MAGCGERGFVIPATYPYSECGDRAILPSVPDMAPFVTIGTRAMASPDMRRPFRILECFPPLDSEGAHTFFSDGREGMTVFRCRRWPEPLADWGRQACAGAVVVFGLASPLWAASAPVSPCNPTGALGTSMGGCANPPAPPSCEETFRRGFGKDDVHDL